jgi:hypothetical protein
MLLKDALGDARIDQLKVNDPVESIPYSGRENRCYLS